MSLNSSDSVVSIESELLELVHRDLVPTDHLRTPKGNNVPQGVDPNLHYSVIIGNIHTIIDEHGPDYFIEHYIGVDSHEGKEFRFLLFEPNNSFPLFSPSELLNAHKESSLDNGTEDDSDWVPFFEGDQIVFFEGLYLLSLNHIFTNTSSNRVEQSNASGVVQDKRQQVVDLCSGVTIEGMTVSEIETHTIVCVGYTDEKFHDFPTSISLDRS